MAWNTRFASWPGRSRLTSTGAFFHLRSSSRTATATASSVLSPMTTSTSGTRWAGSQKWVVTVRSGWTHLALISVMRRPLVLEQMGTSTGSTASSWANRFCLASTFSMMASMTRRAFSAVLILSSLVESSSIAFSASSWVFNSFSSRRRMHSMAFLRPFSARSALVSTSTVLLPARALIAPMPLPIIPLPTTITISLILTFSSRCVQSSGNSSTTRPFVLPSRSNPNASLICSKGTVL